MQFGQKVALYAMLHMAVKTVVELEVADQKQHVAIAFCCCFPSKVTVKFSDEF